MEEQQLIKMSKMESNIEHLTKSFDEFRIDTKDFHKQQSQAIDDMKKQWQEMGGFMKGMADLQKNINECNSWINKYGPFLVAIVEKEQDNRRRWLDAGFKFGGMVLMFILSLYVYINGKTATIELQDTAFNQLIKSLEEKYETQN